MSTEFEVAAEKVKNLKQKPTDDELLELYGLYKQATVGDVDTARPGGMIDFKGKSKWDAWNTRKGMTKAAAEEEYIKLVEKLVGTHGI